MQSIGLGSIVIGARSPIVPPFPSTAADNGLSVDAGSGHIVLADDFGVFGGPGRLLSSRTLDMQGLALQMAGFNLGILFDDNIGVIDLITAGVFNGMMVNSTGNNQVAVIANNRNSSILLDGNSGQTFIGDPFGIGLGFELVVDGSGTIQFQSIFTADHFFRIVALGGLYQMGDIDASLNGLHFSIDDNTGNFIIDNTAHNAVVNINGVAGFTGTVTPVTSITVNGGIVTAVS